jgi:hypothetical protein
VIGNVSARLSRVDIRTLNGGLNGDHVQDNISGGGLSNTACVIPVRW